MHKSHPHETLVASGTIPVPPGFDLAAMESYFRSELWPRPRPGHKRWRRVLQFSNRGKTLNFQVFDVPTAVNGAN